MKNRNALISALLFAFLFLLCWAGIALTDQKSPISFASLGTLPTDAPVDQVPETDVQPVISASPTPSATNSTPASDPSIQSEDADVHTPAPTPSPTATLVTVPPQYVKYRDKVVVLMYHHIALSEAGEEITITPERFEKQLQAVKDQHYQVISMEQYIEFINGRQKVPPNAVVITFDDGYESFYTYAYPILKKLGFTATNFVVVSYISSYYPKLPFLTWKEILEMHRDGFSFYSHTYNLHRKAKGSSSEPVPALTNRLYLQKENRLETKEEYRKRVRDDLLLAKNLLHDNLGNQYSLLCFPFGAYNQTVEDIAKGIGIDTFFTVKDGINNGGAHEIFRINAGTRYVSADRLVQKLGKFSDKAVPTPKPATSSAAAK